MQIFARIVIEHKPATRVRSVNPQGIQIAIFGAERIIRYHGGTISIFSSNETGTIIQTDLPK